jgi:hypothetical protein
MYKISEVTTIKKYINVNTKFRPFIKGSQEKNTDFIIDLPNPIRNVLSMKLKSFNAPNVEYTFSVNETNNSFKVISGGSEITVSVTPGRYTVVNQNLLLEQVNAQLVPFGISLIYISELQKYAFTGPNILNVEINFDVQNNFIYNTFGWILGFHKSYYSKDPKYFGVYPDTKCKKNQELVDGITSIGTQQYYLANSSVILPNTSLYYMLYVDDYLNNMEDGFYEGCFPSNTNIKNILAKITTKYGYDNNTFYETDTDASFQRVYSGPVTLKKLHIRLYDDDNNIVEFNDSNYTFLLEVVTKV